MVADRAECGRVKPFFPNAFFVPVVLLVLAACQTPRVLDVPMDHEFQIEGKLAIRSTAQRHSARFRWAQTGEDYRIELWGPLGQGRTILEGNSRRLKVLDGGGRTLESGAVHAVMRKQLGWYLPLEALPQWVQGGPIEQLPVSGPMIDGKGRMIAFDQLGWRLGYTYSGEATEPNRVRAVMGDYQVLLVLTRPARSTGSAPDSAQMEAGAESGT